MKEEHLIETLYLLIDDALSNLHTNSVARVTAVNETTINCRPVINRVVKGKSIALPEFIEVPVIFMQGGSSYIAMPIAVGDYCKLYFTERCFDAWWNGQDYVSPPESRMHDYSDAFALVGVNPKNSAITIPSVITQNGDTKQIGNYDHDGNRIQSGNYDLTGDMNVEGDVSLNGNYIQEGNFTITGDMQITGAVVINGSLIVNGGIAASNFTGIDGSPMTSTADIETTGDVKSGAISLKTHVHGGVETGGGTTGGPS